MNGFKKCCVAAVFFALNPLTAYAAQENNTSFYADSLSLSEGLDSAVMSAFFQAADSITLGSMNKVKIKEDDAYSAVTDLRLNAGKLNVVLDTDKVAAVLEKYGAHAWQGLSDPIIVWMYESGPDSGNFVGSELSSFAGAFVRSADNYKYRLMFPLLDLEDIQSVTYDTLTKADNGMLVTASKRYGSDFVIASVVKHLDDGNILINCRLLDKDGKILYDFTGDGSETVLADNQAKAIAGALSKLQQVNTTTAAAIEDPDKLGAHEEFVRLKLYGINNLNDLVSFERVLSGIGVEGNINCAMVSDSDAFIVDVYTKLDPASLDGSLEHSSEFSKIEPFAYRYNHGTAKLNPQINSVGRASAQRPDTRVADLASSPVNFPASLSAY